MNAFFYFAMILSVCLLSPFVFDSFTAIRYTLIGMLAVYFIVLAISEGLFKVNRPKVSSPRANHTGSR